jgi:uncharacterized protein involved in exopolysaccharide biosynthesis
VEDRVSRTSVDDVLGQGLVLRHRLGAIAASIASTEEEVADTLERVARGRPNDAPRLLERAAQARSFAALERDRAVACGYVQGEQGHEACGW